MAGYDFKGSYESSYDSPKSHAFVCKQVCVRMCWQHLHLTMLWHGLTTFETCVKIQLKILPACFSHRMHQHEDEMRLK